MAEKSFKPTQISTSERDWVRMQIGDRDTSKMVFDDIEIDAILEQEANKFLAAAHLGQIMLTTKTQGAVEKAVGDLRIRYSDSPQSAFSQHIQELRERGAALMLPNQTAFTLLGC